ncbi:hypothetical protein [Arthrobacter sp. NPDC057013]|uniref:hypothetical protein n=1 Tax=Arthrobacter sp. NPDC057013 TaxID=3345999 RepID=UPI003630BF48
MSREPSKASVSTPESNSIFETERHRPMGAKALVLRVLLALAVLCLVVVMGSLSVNTGPGGTGSSQATSTQSPTQSPTPSPTPTDDLGRLCAQAAGLTQGGKPADALALIEKIRGQVRSPALLATTACEGERLAAVRAAAQPPPTAPPQNPAEKAGANWERFNAEWIMPLSKAGLALLGLAAGFLVLGRLLVLLPKISGVRKSPADRALLALSGLAFILSGSCLIVLAPDWNASAIEGKSFGQMFAGGLLALFGSLVLAVYLSSRLRVTLDVRDTKGETSKVDVSQIGALLHELGADAPRGLEIPEGSDVTALADNAMPVSFTNKVLAAVQKLVVSIFGVTPWRVVVSSSNEASMTVSMARNGSSVGAVTIDGKELQLARGKSEKSGTDDKTATAAETNSAAELELHKMASAYILVTLAKKHYGFEGLCGATDWRSLGLHYIATTDTTMADERQKKLLGAAVDHDAGNMLAEVALQHALFRESTDKETIKTYADWLSRKALAMRADIDRRAISEAGYSPLLHRVEKTFLSAVLNLPPASWEFHQLQSHARQVAERLVQELAPSKRYPIPAPLAQAMRLEAALAHHDLLDAKKSPDDLYIQALRSTAPHTAYNAACSIARNQGLAGKDEVERRLQYALSDERLKEWARRDPELAELRKSEDFLHFLGVKPRQDFWKLEAFEPYEKQLRRAGIARPSDLYAHEVGQSDISAYVQVSPLVIKRLSRLASLVRRALAVPEEADANGRVGLYRVEVVGALVQAGIESPDEIHDEWLAAGAPGKAKTGQSGDFIIKLQKSMEERLLMAPDGERLKSWLRQLKSTPAGETGIRQHRVCSSFSFPRFPSRTRGK